MRRRCGERNKRTFCGCHRRSETGSHQLEQLLRYVREPIFMFLRKKILAQIPIAKCLVGCESIDNRPLQISSRWCKLKKTLNWSASSVVYGSLNVKLRVLA